MGILVLITILLVGAFAGKAIQFAINRNEFNHKLSDYSMDKLEIYNKSRNSAYMTYTGDLGSSYRE